MQVGKGKSNGLLPGCKLQGQTTTMGPCRSLLLFKRTVFLLCHLFFHIQVEEKRDCVPLGIVKCGWFSSELAGLMLWQMGRWEEGKKR